MELETLRLERPADAVARIVLHRPEAFNAVSLKLALELREALRRVEMDRGIRALILTGEGKAFCAGGDVAAFHAALPAPEQLIKDIVLPLHDAVAIMTAMDKPVIAAVNGVAAGAGAGLMLASDLAIAGQSAKLALAYAGIGASPDGGTTYYLPRIVGLRKALQLALESRTLDATEAHGLGIFSEVVPDAALQATALERATRLAAGPTRAYGATKRLLHASFDSSFESQLMREGRSIAAMASTADFAEGVTAFAQKRKPSFTGG
jgi:2-(1,2-epoxy-1,2-dihydrophenyl)acetyl-CoA isomerase